MTINLKAITPEMIKTASLVDDIDDAIRPLQEAAGIEDGGLASVVFSGILDHDTWPTATPEDRIEGIENWIKLEEIYLPEPEEPDPDPLPEPVRKWNLGSIHDDDGPKYQDNTDGWPYYAVVKAQEPGETDHLVAATIYRREHAFLIAAAPETREALKVLIERVSIYRNEADWPQTMRDALRQAKAAISLGEAGPMPPECHEAKMKDVRTQLEARGFSEDQMGGGCTAFRWIDGAYEILITDEDGASAPETPDCKFMLGRYRHIKVGTDDENMDELETTTLDGLPAALEMVDRWIRQGLPA